MKSEQGPTAKQIFGGKNNFWIYSKADGYDLTHPESPTSPSPSPRVVVETTKAPVAIDPEKSALVIIDMQQYFLSPQLGRPRDAPGLKAADQLVRYAIPACRKAGIRVVWLQWGVTDEEIDMMPPAIVQGMTLDNNFDNGRVIGGFGAELGHVQLEDGSTIDAGRVLIEGEWNQSLYTPLEEVSRPEDIWINKNRLSGFWEGSGMHNDLYNRGIRTLLFAGGNLDQCVQLSLADAFSGGYDCLLLIDGSATSSPAFAREEVEYNTELGWGFLLTCEDLAKGVKSMEK